MLIICFLFNQRRKMIKIKRIMARNLMRLFGVFPVASNKIVFCSYSGIKYNDSPAAITEELLLDGYDIVWILEDGEPHPQNVRTVKPNSLKSIYELATARVWVDNCRKPIWTVKRKNQYYIQTWHGGVCLKKVELDSEDTLPKDYILSALHDSEMADLFISESAWRTLNYRNAFRYNGEVLECGLPRSDVFFNDKKKIKQDVFAWFGLSPDDNVLLYAPTFRDSHNMDVYNIDYERLNAQLVEKFGGKWKIIVRLHPNIANQNNQITYSDAVLNGSLYPQINELIVASDVLITDYSGCLFDAINCGKKTFIYASDLEEYLMKERELYFDIKKLPASFATSNDELCECIKKFDDVKYKADVEKFVEGLKFFGDGNSANTIANRIREKLDKF